MKIKQIVIKKIYIVILFIAIMVLASFRYYWHLDAHPCFEDDEFQTERVAQWYSDQIGILPQDEIIHELRYGDQYDRAWPFTVLLGNWIHFFGFSESICRGLSALFGVLTVSSLFFIAYKCYHDLRVTTVSCFLLMAEPILTGYFRLTRMYSMAVFLCLWLYFFLFQSLSLHNPFIKNHERFQILDFHPFYMGAALVVLYFAYQVHVNSLIMMLGVAGFIVASWLITRERRYLYWSLLLIAIVGLMVAGILGVLINGTAPFAQGFFRSLTQHGALFQNYYQGYAVYFLRTATNKWLGLFIGIATLVCDMLLLKKKQSSAIDIYLLFVCFVTVFFFVFMTNRYFVEYYMCMLIPIAALFYGSFLSVMERTLKNKCQEFKIKIVCCVLMVMLLLSSVWRIISHYDVLYTSMNAMDYPRAYATVYQYYDKDEEIPVVCLYPREPYFTETLPNANVYILNCEKDMDILYNVATEESPEGILTCEDIKFGALKQGMISFVNTWTDHLSGDNIDDTNVEVSHYWFLYPLEENVSAEEGDTIIVESPNIQSKQKIGNDVANINVGDESFFINLDLKMMSQVVDLNQVDFICVKILYQKQDGTYQERFYQLLVEDEKEMGDSMIACYEVPFDSIRNLDLNDVTDVSVGMEYAYYANNQLYGMDGKELP